MRRREVGVAFVPELSLFVDPHVLRVLQAESGEVLHRFGLCGGEQQRLSGLRKIFHNGVECVCKTHVQNPVGFIQDCKRNGSRVD